MSPEKYVKSAVTNAEENLAKSGKRRQVCHAFVQLPVVGNDGRIGVDGVQCIIIRELIAAYCDGQLRLDVDICWKPRCYRRSRFAS
jgi:hypothetical protein